VSGRPEFAVRVASLAAFLLIVGAWGVLRSGCDASHEALGVREQQLHRLASMQSAVGDDERIAALDTESVRALFDDAVCWSRRGDALFLTFESPVESGPLAMRGGR